jgi:hypothetical protein
MKYLPPVFIGVCVALFVETWNTYHRRLLGFVLLNLSSVVSISCFLQIEQHKPQ